jgi:DNA-binding transcriptional ArsR family regulator
MGDKTQARRTRSALKDLAPFRSLLSSLAGRSPSDFSARLAVLQAITEYRRPVFSSRELGEGLSWLPGKTRLAALRALIQGGWLEKHPAAGLILTETGRRAYAALQLLHRGEELTSDEMTAALRRKSLGELASAGREALLPALLPLTLLSTDGLIQAAESVLRE